MNSLFNHALKQSQSLKRDIETFASSPGTTSLGLQGQISATLATLQRTIEEYDAVARRELVPAKQDKAFARIRNFRSEIADARTQFEKLKREREEVLNTQNRTELLGRRPHATATPDNPYGMGNNSSTGISDSIPAAAIPREFIQRTGDQLDEFIERGRSVLGDLVEQRNMLKSTQRKLYSAANTLGISNDTIKYIERRAQQDKLVFWGGVTMVVVAFYLIIRWLK
ncbi:membrin [Myxozyma melibiosi]|uniref:Protein transport protein BOS1 n=1 Tax=Myxozyma melibiosi TaxID=54550 RepID=A0ABR1FCT0_9ASCO